jgi:hypothetical protein
MRYFRITVMLSVLADGRKLPPFVSLKKKNLPKENLCSVTFKSDTSDPVDGTEIVPEMSVIFNQLIWLTGREDFINFKHCKNLQILYSNP